MSEPPAGAQEAPPRRNDVFDRLGAQGEDLVGMVAYALYKQSKREWIVQNNPSSEQVGRYHDTVTTTQINLYRDRARSLLSIYGQSVIEQVSGEIEKNAVDRSILREVKRQGGFWRNVWAGVIGAGIIALALIVLSLVDRAPTPKEAGTTLRQQLRPD